MKKRDFIRALTATAAGVTMVTSFPGCSLLLQNDRLPAGWVWITAGNQTDPEWETVFKRLEETGIKGLLLRASEDQYRRIIPMASKHGLEVHAWIITLNRAWDSEAKKHPEWFTISGKGESCFDVHPYVDYYLWVCPSKDEVYSHVEKEVMSLLDIKGMKGVHLDYIRYSDVILPVGLWEKYGLIQDREYPEFDFCYCDTCREKFLSETGVDVRTLEDPAASTEWREYRWNSVTRFVNRLTNRVHSERPGKMLTAAVFPYPEIARAICRQDWAKWDLDAFFPMIYQSFYNEDTDWIGESVAKGIDDLEGRAPLISGLYVPALPPENIQEAMDISMANGASGICYFNYNSLNEEHWEIVKRNKY